MTSQAAVTKEPSAAASRLASATTSPWRRPTSDTAPGAGVGGGVAAGGGDADGGGSAATLVALLEVADRIGAAGLAGIAAVSIGLSAGAGGVSDWLISAGRPASLAGEPTAGA